MGTERACGPCLSCCHVPAIQELDKPERVTCRHACAAGCGIYTAPERPAVCAAFRCAWLAGDFEDGDRPDRTGVMFTRQDNGLLRAFECWPNAFKRIRAGQLLANVAEPFVKLHYDGHRTAVVMGEGERELPSGE